MCECGGVVTPGMSECNICRITDQMSLVTYENMYFKSLPGEPALMSGLRVPNLDSGPYRFVRCDFHPRLREWKLEAKNRGCVFVN